MAEMRASPVKSQALKRLADIVRSVEQGGEMEFLPFNPMSLFPVSSTTLENLAYGNLPMAIPSQSNIPITKTGRKQEVAELAGLLMSAQPVGRGVAKGANYLGDVLTRAVTRNPQATSMRALDEIARMSPVSQMFDPRLAKRVMPQTTVVDEAGNPRLLYHGTTEDFKQFDPGTRGAVFASPDPKFTNVYAGEDMDRYLSGGNVRPVYVDAKNPFDYDNPDHVQAVVQYIKKNDPDFADIADSVGEKVGTGVYSQIERPLVQNAIRQLGFDGFFVQERGTKNIAVFDPQQVKSAISDPDIMEQFLSSSKTPIAGLLEPQAGARQSLESIVDKAKSKKIDLQVAESDNLIDLGFLQTPARGRGLGTETMRDLISYADQTGKPIRLTPDANMAKNMDKARLVEFYENLGFKKQEPTETPKTSGFRKFAPTYWVYTPKD